MTAGVHNWVFPIPLNLLICLLCKRIWYRVNNFILEVCKYINYYAFWGQSTEILPAIDSQLKVVHDCRLHTHVAKQNL